MIALYLQLSHDLVFLAKRARQHNSANEGQSFKHIGPVAHAAVEHADRFEGRTYALGGRVSVRWTTMRRGAVTEGPEAARLP